MLPASPLEDNLRPLPTVLRPSVKALTVTLSVLIIAALSAWALLASGPLKSPGSASAAEPHLGASGYTLVASDGGIFTYGDAAFHGSTGGMRLDAPIVGMAATPGGGYWLVASDGGIFSYGNAAFYGSTGGLHLDAPIVGMAATPDGGGYWLVAKDGGIFSYGNATFHGSTGGMHLDAPIVGMAATPDGGGYWLVASDGGIFSYGNAAFYGSTGGLHLDAPIVGMAATPGGGYWLVASDGGVFTYGDAAFYGSTGGLHLDAPIVGMAATPDGGGYWLVAHDGGIFTYGDAAFYGSTGGLHLDAPIVGMAATRQPTTANGAPPGTLTWACTKNEPIDDPAQGGWVYWENGTCQYPADTTNFVGMNNSGGPIGLYGNAVEEDAWGPICAQANGDEVPSVGATASAGTSGTGTVTVPTWATANNDVGVELTDYTNPSRVKGGTTVTAVNTSTGVLTLSANLIGTVTGDEIVVGQGVNDPTCVTRQTQVLQANSAQNWQVTADVPANPSGAVTTYPNVGTYAYTGVVDNYTSLTSTYSESMPINASTKGWAMQDDWLTEPGSAYTGDDPGTYEVEIQYDLAQAATCPTTWSQGNYGLVASDVMIDGVAWHVCDGQAAHNSDGTCSTTGPYCGPIVFQLGATESDSPSVTSSSGTLDLKAIVTWLETHDVPDQTYPYVEPGSSMSAISEGWEIASTGGVPEQFTGSGFTVHAVGGAAG